MGQLLVLKQDGIYTANGDKYVAPPKPVRVEILRECDHRPDPRFQRRIDRQVGLNRFGEPLYRLVWGWQRLDWLAGLVDRYNDKGTWLCQQYGLFYEPKYSYLGSAALDRWIVEKWMPPEDYGTRETWEYETEEVEGARTTQALGPYPSRGDYELSFVIQDQKAGHFLQLTSEMVERIIGVTEVSRRLDSDKRRQLLEEEEERKQKALKNEIEELWDDAAVAFGGNPNTTQANAPMHNTQRSVADVAKFPVNAPQGASVA